MSRQAEFTRRIVEILTTRNSPFAVDVASVDDVRLLPRPVRERIVDELGDEFTSKGLNANSEPNAYGLEIEDLTDACGLAYDPPAD